MPQREHQAASQDLLKMLDCIEIAVVTPAPMTVANQSSTGLQVCTYEDVMRLANMVCASGLVKGSNERSKLKS